MKKYMPGFVPVQFHKSGKLLLFLAALFLLVGVARQYSFLIYLAIAMMSLALYLIYVVPREK